MSDIFISHVEEDADIALEIALGLEEAGYRPWCYEIDRIAGVSYLIRTRQAIEQAQAIILIISPHSLGSRQVGVEVIRAHESGKYFFPVLRDITHTEFQNRQPEWVQAIGAATSVPIPREGVSGILKSIIAGLKALGIQPSPKPDTERVEEICKALDKVRSRSVSKPSPTLTPSISVPPIITIMGCKGGVGKTLIAGRIADLIAESKTNVLIVDFDIETAALTYGNLTRANKSLGTCKTVYDHLSQYSGTEPEHAGGYDETLLNVTPEYLRKRDLGEIYLLPARPRGAKGRWKKLADFLAKQTNEALLREIETMLSSHIKTVEKEIGCIIIDCGAALDPLVSAAVYMSDYAFIVGMPQEECRKYIETVMDEHRTYFPQIDERKAKIILNRVVPEAELDRWMSMSMDLVGKIRDDPEIYRTWVQGPFHFEGGFDDFTSEIHHILKTTFKERHQEIIPDEADRLSWVRILVEWQLPKRILETTRFRLMNLLSILLPLGGIMATSYLIYLHNTIAKEPQPILASVTIVTLAIILSITFTVLCTIWSIGHRKKRRLLKEVVSRGGDKDFRRDLLNRPRKGSLKWLWEIFEKEGRKTEE